jgi:hypothetical protein
MITIGDTVVHLNKKQEGIVINAHPQYFKGRQLKSGEEGVIVKIKGGEQEWWHKDNVVVL